MEIQRQISYSFRIEEQLMAQANQIAEANDQKMAQVIRHAIRTYIAAEKKEDTAKKPSNI